MALTYLNSQMIEIPAAIATLSARNLQTTNLTATSIQTPVLNNVQLWNDISTVVQNNSASWEETADIIPTVANYLSTQNIAINTATLNSASAANLQIGSITNSTNVIGNLTVYGTLTALSGFNVVIASTTSTSALSVSNIQARPALDVYQGPAHPIISVFKNNTGNIATIQDTGLTVSGYISAVMGSGIGNITVANPYEAGLRLNCTGSGGVNWDILSAPSTSPLLAGTLNFYNRNLNISILTLSGTNVGIGTQTPTEKLEVFGNTRSTSFYSNNPDSQSLTSGAIVINGGSGAILLDDSGQKRISWNDGGGNFNIRGGNYYNGTNTVYAKGASDARGGAANITLWTDGQPHGSITLWAASSGVEGTTVNIPITLTVNSLTSSIDIASVSNTYGLIVNQYGTGPAAYLNGNVDVVKSAPGSSVISKVTNTSNTAGSQARFDLATGTPNAYSILFQQDGPAPYGEYSHGPALTGGMFFTAASASPIVFRQGPSERMRITGAGNVGIGTTNPLAKLHVAGGALRVSDTLPIITLNETDATANNGTWDIMADGGTLRLRAVNDAYSAAGDALYIDRTGTTIDSVIFPNGRVGIGTTAPDAELHVRGTTFLDGLFLDGGAGSSWFRVMPGNLVSQGAYNGMTQTGDNTIIYTSGVMNSGSLVIAPWANTTGGIRMLSSGSVGIGTPFPNQTLTVAGNISATGTASVSALNIVSGNVFPKTTFNNLVSALAINVNGTTLYMPLLSAI